MLLKNERDTQLFAQKLVKFSRGNNIVICLNGTLGSGKTTFSRYFIQESLKEAKIKEIPSQTFNLLKVYEHKNIKINHFDFYRLNSAAELVELNFMESTFDDACLIEWSDKFKEILPSDRIEIIFKILKNNTRNVGIKKFGRFKDIKIDG
jgi:tRNA threonylcarbamoyl adenosine modification protein YjeE